MKTGIFDRQPGHRHLPSSGYINAECLVTLGCLAAIVLFVVLAVSGAAIRSAAFQGLNNLHELTGAWTRYATDNDGQIPSATSQPTYPELGMEEWSGGGSLDLPVNERAEVDPYWVRDQDDRSVSNSPLWPYLSKNPLLFRDPADPSTGQWPGYRNGEVVPRVRSYAMNAFLGGAPWRRTTVNSSTGEPFQVFTSLDSIAASAHPGTENTFVFISEHPGSITRGQFYVDMTDFRSDSGFRLNLVDVPSAWHGGAGTLSFADGHAEIRQWRDPRTFQRFTRNKEAQLNIPHPQNGDVRWLQERTTW